MVTATSPIYDKNNNFLGVAAADINLSTIQEKVANIKVGENGKAFLIDKDGLLVFIFQKQKSIQKLHH